MPYDDDLIYHEDWLERVLFWVAMFFYGIAITIWIVLIVSSLAHAQHIGKHRPTCFGLPASIIGTGSDDFIVGTDGADVIVTKNGSDIVFSGKGHDVVCGQRGPDRLFGGDGFDKVNGGKGADVCDGESARSCEG